MSCIGANHKLCEENHFHSGNLQKLQDTIETPIVPFFEMQGQPRVWISMGHFLGISFLEYFFFQ